MRAKILLPAAMLAILTACGSEPEAVREVDDDRGAEGEVLGGTISDEMPPLHSVRSQSPPLQPSPEMSGNGSNSSGSNAANDDASEDGGERGNAQADTSVAAADNSAVTGSIAETDGE